MLKTEAALGKTLGELRRIHFELHGFKIPAWIPGGEPAVASIGLLGLIGLLLSRAQMILLLTSITKIADGVVGISLR